MASVRELLALAAGLDSDSAALDAEVLLCHCLDKPRSWLFTWPERELAPGAEQQFRELMIRRAAGEPVAYLTGQRGFWSLDLEVSADTLIPRPDTETLIIWALELPLPSAARVVDLGTGSGAIACALAAERPNWSMTATDASAAALQVARRNSERHCAGRLRLRQGSWFEPLGSTSYDLIVCNPPYIAASDPHLQQGDVRFEPDSALVSGDDGLDALRHIAATSGSHLCAGGYLLLEHGYQQGAAVRELLVEAGFDQVATRCDLAGQERISGGCKDA